MILQGPKIPVVGHNTTGALQVLTKTRLDGLASFWAAMTTDTSATMASAKRGTNSSSANAIRARGFRSVDFFTSPLLLPALRPDVRRDVKIARAKAIIDRTLAHLRSYTEPKNAYVTRR